MWQRLGFHSRNVQSILHDHALPETVPLRHAFPVLEAVARSGASMIPFHHMRDPDHLLAPGAVVYMDFAALPCSVLPPLGACSDPHYMCQSLYEGNGAYCQLQCLFAVHR